MGFHQSAAESLGRLSRGWFDQSPHIRKESYLSTHLSLKFPMLCIWPSCVVTPSHGRFRSAFYFLLFLLSQLCINLPTRIVLRAYFKMREPFLFAYEFMPPEQNEPFTFRIKSAIMLSELCSSILAYPQHLDFFPFRKNKLSSAIHRYSDVNSSKAWWRSAN